MHRPTWGWSLSTPTKYLKFRYPKTRYSLQGCSALDSHMPKAIYRTEYGVFLTLLKARRLKAGLTQVECSKALGRPQSFMSDVERGARRLDIIQIHDLCNVLG